MMILKGFKVTNFRSIIDSGYIDCDDVTALVGINEAGKSNVILALWKLKPVRDGKIDLLHDMPTKEYSSWRNIPEKICFISANFSLNTGLIDKIVSICNCNKNSASIVNIKRYFNGDYDVSFPNYNENSLDASAIKDLVENAIIEINNLNEKTKAESGIKEKVLKYYNDIINFIFNKQFLIESDYDHIKSLCPNNITQSATSEIYPHLQNINDLIKKLFSNLNSINPTENKDVKKFVLSEMPSFVYYSNYGNLDAQIYLPHAIKWLKGEKIEGINNDSKVRTLRVLFDFVKLDPQEILDLGKDPVKIVRDNYGTERVTTPTKEEIEKATEQKTARTILLNSASSDLTRKFREWWKQGNYIFRFQTDGDVFKIWVSDEKRTEEIELERRSTGLQWFLSFFLTFLVESQEAHKGAILLLDEAGLTLHPLAQKDLMAFFENLAKTNQLLYTTHSPFLVDTSNIDRVKVVYSDDNGLTVASSNLRASEDKINEKSIYSVHAALGLSVSDILLQGCQSIIVEGPSDQHYFNAIKQYLIKNKKYTPNMELVFIPSGGVRGIPGIVSLIGGKNGELPLVILDSDGSGKSSKIKLESGLYQNQANAIIDIGNFSSIANCEVEDLIPPSLLFKHINRLFSGIDDSFEDAYISNQAIVTQIENFAIRNKFELQKGWKVEIAKGFKQQILKAKNDIIPDECLEKWEQLFNKFNI